MNLTIRNICRWWRRRCAERRLSSIPGYPKAAEIKLRRDRHEPVRDLLHRRREAIHRQLKGGLV